MRTEEEVRENLQYTNQEVEDMEDAVKDVNSREDADYREERARFGQYLRAAKNRRSMLMWMLGSKAEDEAWEANEKAAREAARKEEGDLTELPF